MRSCQCSRIFLEPHEPHPCQRPLGTTYTHLEDAIPVISLMNRRHERQRHRTARRYEPQHDSFVAEGSRSSVREIASHSNPKHSLRRRTVRIWGLVQKKEAHKWPWEAHDDKVGDAYCFVAIERNLKLVPAHRLGRLSDADTNKLAKDVRRATAPQRYQLTTDGFKPYIKAIATHLRDRVDYAQLKKSLRHFA